MHMACFKLFVRGCKSEEAMRRLWIATSWKIPWRGAPDLHLEHATRTAFIPSLAAEGAGFARLAHLPPEIVRFIQDYSASSILWTYSSAMDLASQMTGVLPQEGLISFPLQEVLAWERGGSPLLAARPQRTTIRLTIDVRGIKKIERFVTSPPYCNWRSDSLVFVIVKDDEVADAIMHFKVRCLQIPLSTFSYRAKYGFCRLQLPNSTQGLQIWDTPTPPDLDRCVFFPAGISSTTQFCTVELCKTEGFTFFFCHGDIYAIHAHTPTTPSAQTTYDRLPPRRQRSVIWLYMPVSSQDHIVAFGMRRGQLSSGWLKYCLLVPPSTSCTKCCLTLVL